MTAREKGVATTPCPSCQSDLPVVTLPDGGMTTEGCKNCYPAKQPERASATRGRERGSDVQEKKADV